MDNKVQNMILKGIVGIIAILGVLFTVWVMQGGSPSSMGPEEMEQLAIREAIDQNLNDSKTQAELDMWIAERGPQIKAELEEAQYGNVSLIINFTTWVLYIALFAIVGAFIYMFTVDVKKALFSLMGIVGIVLFMIIVYYSVGDVVPADLVAKESTKGLEPDQLIFTSGNWRIASAAVVSTVILAVIALIGWIGGEIRRAIR